MFLLAQIWFAPQPMPVSSITVARLASISPLWTFWPRQHVHFICDIDNKKEWQHFKLKRCHSVGLYAHSRWHNRYDFSTFKSSSGLCRAAGVRSASQILLHFQPFKVILGLSPALFAVLDGLFGAITDARHAVGAVCSSSGAFSGCLPGKLEFYAFLIGCLITVFHFSGATFLASDIQISWCNLFLLISLTYPFCSKQVSIRATVAGSFSKGPICII